MMDIRNFSPSFQRALILVGPFFTVLFFMGFVISGLLPPTDPSASAEEIAQHFVDDKNRIRVGATIMCIAFSLFAVWGACIATWTRRSEQGFPVLSYTQLASLGASVAILALLPMGWAMAAFRPEDTSPDVTRMLNDASWFIFMFPWPPFSVWCAAVGLAILREGGPTPTFPRWTGYLSLWCALMLGPALLMIFFKDGPMAYDGIIAFWIPMLSFFVWVVAMTYAMLRHVHELAHRVAVMPDDVEAAVVTRSG